MIDDIGHDLLHEACDCLMIGDNLMHSAICTELKSFLYEVLSCLYGRQSADSVWLWQAVC